MFKKLAKKQPKILHFEELEQRLLFSADVVPGLDSLAVEEQVLVEDIAKDVQVERETAPVEMEQTAGEQCWELVLVNENVDDYEQLIADLQGSDNNRIIEVVVLQSDRDGIKQVNEILSERSDLAAVHVISHGADGQINLGNSWLDGNTLQQNRDAVAGWGNALTETGDILFYGCNIAADSDGQTLLSNLAQLTGADVAASDDPTGHASLGGDWEMEYHAGAIETEVSIDEETQDNWHALLATATDDFSSGDYTGGSGWTSDWQESGGDGSSSSGAIRIIGNQLNLADGEVEAPIWLYRTINLSGATTATLEFDWGRDGESYENQISVGISTNGSDWTPLMALPDGGSLGTQHESIDISAHISATTYIRFVRGDWGTGDHQIDNVLITHDGTGGNQDPPTIDLDGDDSSTVVGAHFQTTWTKGSGAVVIADADAILTDPQGTLSSLTVNLDVRFDGADEILSADTSGTSITASYNAGTGVLTLSSIR